MIIDTHTHFYDPTRPQGVPWPSPDNALLYRPVLPQHYRALAGAEDVRGTVVVEASAWLEDNQWILDLAAEDPFIVGLVGHIDPCTGEFGRHLERFAPHPLFCGIRCGGRYFEDVGKGGFLADMEALAGRDLELDVLLRKEQFPGLLALCARLPELRVVVDHIAHVSIDGETPDEEWVEGVQRLAECPQVYMKVSAVMEQSRVQPAPEDLDFYRPALEVLWAAFGEERLVYGSNWPVCERAGTFAAALEIVRAFFAEKGEEALEKYFWKNGQRAYGWVER